MYQYLKEKLRALILTSYPEIPVSLDAEISFSTFLEDKLSTVMPLVMQGLEDGKPGYVIEEIVIGALKSSLGPSRCNYIKGVLESEFPLEYVRFTKAGVLNYELIGLVHHCDQTFRECRYDWGKEHDRLLRYAIIGNIYSFFKSS